MKKGIFAIFCLVVAMLVVSPVWAEDAPTKEECVAMCQNAATLMTEQGVDEALKQIGDPNGPFVWKGTYVFTIDMEQATVSAHPINPKLVGKSLMGMKDTNGKMFFAEFINVARNQGEGWVDYMWPKPGEKTPSPKTSYVLRVPGTNYVMLAGIYL
ncbi:MAG: cache domain-containing protein [Desulfatibacillum sp.]|nr:cache domain-containing protein [Desulfatibacillum sp.]